MFQYKSSEKESGAKREEGSSIQNGKDLLQEQSKVEIICHFSDETKKTLQQANAETAQCHGIYGPHTIFTPELLQHCHTS